MHLFTLNWRSMVELRSIVVICVWFGLKDLTFCWDDFLVLYCIWYTLLMFHLREGGMALKTICTSINISTSSPPYYLIFEATWHIEAGHNFWDDSNKQLAIRSRHKRQPGILFPLYIAFHITPLLFVSLRTIQIAYVV